jgi:hypothetical protein
VSPRTSSASRAATCSTRWWPAPPIRRCWPTSRGVRCTRRSPPCAGAAGHVDAHHRLWIGAILRHIDFLDEQIDRLSEAIEEPIRPFIGAVEVLVTMTGIQRRGAECVIGEIGVDMSRFATARHLASWAGRCPGNDQSAGKRRSGKTRNGSKWLDYALEEAAMAAIRVKDNYFAAQYQRLKPRRGHKKALGAVKHSMLCAIWPSPPARPIATSPATTSPPATPNARPDAYSNSSNASDTTSRSRRPRQPERTFPVRQRSGAGHVVCRRSLQAEAAAR